MELFDKLITPKLSEEEIIEITKYAEEGNIPAKLTLILHNQRLLNEKINTLLAYGETKNTSRQSEAERTYSPKQTEEV